MKLILDHDFTTPLPSVDLSPFHHHGRVMQVAHDSDGRSAGSGALRFGHADSAVRIATSPAWQSLGALAIEAWIRLEGSSHRRNILEGDGSFALFVAADGSLEGSVRALVDGVPAPAWHSVSSSTHGVGGTPQLVPVGRWSKVVFHHDGVTRARLFVDDHLVASRSDYRSGVSGVGSAGVVVGNWTLSSQYAFKGDIDRVRVWKRDPAALINRFSARPVSPEARDMWDALWDCLHRELDQDRRQLFGRAARDATDVIRELFRAIQSAPPEEQAMFRALVDRYRDAWRADTIDGDDAVSAIVDLLRWMRGALPPAWHATLEDVSNRMVALLMESRCLDADRLAAVDSAYATFIRNAVARASA